MDRLRYAWRDAWQSMRQTRGVLGGSLVAIAFSLMLVGLAVAGRANLSYLSQQVRLQSIVTAYLNPHDSASAIQLVTDSLRRQPGVIGVQYVSSRVVLAQMRITLGPDSGILSQLGNINPFTGYLAIQVYPAAAARIAGFAARQSTVALIADNQQVLSRLAAINETVNWAGAGMLVLAGVVAMVVIAHVIRLSLYSRREDIETLRWMGASESFVAMPFILQGMLIGVMGGVLAAIILGPSLMLLIGAGKRALPFVPLLSGDALWQSSGWLVAGMGMVCGAIGSAWALISGRAARI